MNWVRQIHGKTTIGKFNDTTIPLYKIITHPLQNLYLTNKWFMAEYTMPAQMGVVTSSLNTLRLAARYASAKLLTRAGFSKRTRLSMESRGVHQKPPQNHWEALERLNTTCITCLLQRSILHHSHESYNYLLHTHTTIRPQAWRCMEQWIVLHCQRLPRKLSYIMMSLAFS